MGGKGGPHLPAAVFSSNYLRTEKEVINNPGRQPETAQLHNALGEGPRPKRSLFIGGVGECEVGWNDKVIQKGRWRGVGTGFHCIFLVPLVRIPSVHKSLAERIRNSRLTPGKQEGTPGKTVPLDKSAMRAKIAAQSGSEKCHLILRRL